MGGEEAREGEKEQERGVSGARKWKEKGRGNTREEQRKIEGSDEGTRNAGESAEWVGEQSKKGDPKSGENTERRKTAAGNLLSRAPGKERPKKKERERRNEKKERESRAGEANEGREGRQKV